MYSRTFCGEIPARVRAAVREYSHPTFTAAIAIETGRVRIPAIVSGHGGTGKLRISPHALASMLRARHALESGQPAVRRSLL